VLVNVTILVGVLAVATGAGFLWRRYNGHFRGAPSRTAAEMPGEAALISEQDIGAALGRRATLVQFSSAFCAPCRATRRVLAEVAEMVPGVEHVEIDAEHHLDLVRRLNVLRTPTTFVVDARGAIATRASGQPRKVDVIAALGHIE
jgi:thiol-disulfide isomerase/thioredoxin